MRIHQREIAVAGLLITVFGFMMSAKHYTNVESLFMKPPVQGDKDKLINGDRATRDRAYGAGNPLVFIQQDLEDMLALFDARDADKNVDYDYGPSPL